MTRTKATRSISIARPRSAVFDFLASRFFETYGSWGTNIDQLQRLTSVPLRAGGRGRLVRSGRGGLIELRVEVKTYEPPCRFSFRAQRDITVLASTFVLEEANGSTAVIATRMVDEPSALSALHITPRRRVRRDLDSELHNPRTALEAMRDQP